MTSPADRQIGSRSGPLELSWRRWLAVHVPVAVLQGVLFALLMDYGPFDDGERAGLLSMLFLGGFFGLTMFGFALIMEVWRRRRAARTA